MTESEEKAYSRGERAALRSIMSECARKLGYDDPLRRAAALISEREQAIVTLRKVCEEYGDNDWSDDAHLADIIEKHLHRVLDENCVDENDE